MSAKDSYEPEAFQPGAFAPGAFRGVGRRPVRVPSQVLSRIAGTGPGSTLASATGATMTWTYRQRRSPPGAAPIPPPVQVFVGGEFALLLLGYVQSFDGSQ
jgi:hypothetical protein